ncbi:MAG: bifunctional metallophosphatase/5'-nucleotidase [Muribaculaceae bacterium]|nr:bifunctional metallophosphatase/5'-nucleotidase [Muribaculaceae bacterium]
MKRYIKYWFAALIAGCMAVQDAGAERLVILHTNDTHSQIDPTEKNLGGVLRRKVVIDSVRAAEPNVLLVDAGDAVQGTLYFSLFGGEVEQRVMNELGYDIQILGNHEFDNGMEALARYLKGVNATKLTSNYRLDGSTLEGIMEPYTIKQIGDTKVGFIAINLIPKGMISDDKSEGVEYLDGVKAANSFAWLLKHYLGCDMVVAVTHIGYENQPGCSDVDIARNSEDIDIIIGGHTHTTLDPADASSKPWRVANMRGDSVLVAQTGNAGRNVGEIIIDLDSHNVDYKLIPVNARLDDRVDAGMAEMIRPYREKIDSVLTIKIGKSAAEMSNKEPALLNFVTDCVRNIGADLTGSKIDLAIMNRGGLRRPLMKGAITKGEIMQIMPFDNSVEVLDISGRDLLDAFDVMAGRGGDGVSINVSVTYDPATGRCTEVLIDGTPLDPERTYRLSTINYLAAGGDYMEPLKQGKRVAISPDVLYEDMIRYFVSGPMKGKTLKPDNTRLWRTVK